MFVITAALQYPGGWVRRWVVGKLTPLTLSPLPPVSRAVDRPERFEAHPLTPAKPAR